MRLLSKSPSTVEGAPSIIWSIPPLLTNENRFELDSEDELANWGADRLISRSFGSVGLLLLLWLLLFMVVAASILPNTDPLRN
jgi:hypothetical protein